MLDKAKLAKLLRSLAQIVESSTDDEIDALARANISALTVFGSVEKKRRNQSKGLPPRQADSVDVAGIIESMKYISSREAGISFLERHELNKRSLEQIARRLDVPVLREDTSGRIMQKIVEATVGPRLNSEAIRGRADNLPLIGNSPANSQMQGKSAG